MSAEIVMISPNQYSVKIKRQDGAQLTFMVLTAEQLHALSTEWQDVRKREQQQLDDIVRAICQRRANARQARKVKS